MKTTKVKLGPQDQATLQERADQLLAAKFRDIRAKLAEDCNKMTSYNTKVQQKANRTHVVEVMHLKSQHAIGQKPFGIISLAMLIQQVFDNFCSEAL